MNTQPPLLPETTFKPLSEKALNAMIDTALTHRQLPREATVINFQHRLAQKLTYTGGLTAMAASIMLAFMFTPQYTTPTSTGTGTDIATTSSDVSDMLLLETIGA